jgi:hypothetical protein
MPSDSASTVRHWGFCGSAPISMHHCTALEGRSRRDEVPVGADGVQVEVREGGVALGVDGAGLSIHGQAQKRTPLGASSNDASTAERLQFTAGAGPCLDAARSGWPVFAVEPLCTSAGPHSTSYW